MAELWSRTAVIASVLACMESLWRWRPAYAHGEQNFACPYLRCTSAYGSEDIMLSLSRVRACVPQEACICISVHPHERPQSILLNL